MAYVPCYQQNMLLRQLEPGQITGVLVSNSSPSRNFAKHLSKCNTSCEPCSTRCFGRLSGLLQKRSGHVPGHESRCAATDHNKYVITLEKPWSSAAGIMVAPDPPDSCVVLEQGEGDNNADCSQVTLIFGSSSGSFDQSQQQQQQPKTIRARVGHVGGVSYWRRRECIVRKGPGETYQLLCSPLFSGQHRPGKVMHASFHPRLRQQELVEWQLQHWLATSHARTCRATAVRAQLAEARSAPPLALARPLQPAAGCDADSYETVDDLDASLQDPPERWPQLVESNAVPYLTPEERKGPRGAGAGPTCGSGTAAPSSSTGSAEDLRAPPPSVVEYLGSNERVQPAVAAPPPLPPWGCKACALLPWLIVSQGRLELPELEAVASQLAVSSVVQVDLAMLLRSPRPRQGPSPYGPRTSPTHLASAAAALHRLAFRQRAYSEHRDPLHNRCVAVHCQPGDTQALATVLAAYLHWFGGLGIREACSSVQDAMGVLPPRKALEMGSSHLLRMAHERIGRVRVGWQYGGGSVDVAGEVAGGWGHRLPLHYSARQARWSAEIWGLRPGLYQLKYVVDSHWMVDPSTAMMCDRIGNVNNQVTVRGLPALLSAEDREYLYRFQACILAFQDKAGLRRH